MSRQQLITLIAINALVSAVVSSLVVFVALSWFAPVAPTPIAAEAPRPLVSPSPTRRTQALSYIVKPGDTLSTIAAIFGISTAALMQANGITNPNVLAVGQAITIPPPDLTPPSLPSGTSIAPVASPVPILRITAILRAAVPSAPTGEMVIIQNIGSRINMKGWTLADLHSNVYVFPDFVLESNSGVRVHTDSGLDTATDLFWGRSTAVWDANDTATLKDRGGVVVDSYTIRK